MPKNKTKGSNLERELCLKLISRGYRAVRVAGSGAMKNADCDIIAGNRKKKYCIEAKSSKKLIKYISKEQMNRFISFARIFGLEPLIALRFDRQEWIFVRPNQLKESGKTLSMSLEKAKKVGKKFEEIFK